MPAGSASRPLCPECGQRARPVSRGGAYVCGEPNCGAELPPRYVEERLPQTIVSCVGYMGHGKTLYLTSLLGSLTDGLKHNLGGEFLAEAINHPAFRIVVDGWTNLKAGVMPRATDMAFQSPGICRAEGLGSSRTQTLAFLDMAGGIFERWDPNSIDPRIVSIFGAADVLWIVCSPMKEKVAAQLQLLMQAYVNYTVSQKGGVALLRHKRVVVIYTKADRLLPAFDALGYADVGNYLMDDPRPVDREYMNVLRYISGRLADFTCTHVAGGPGFHAMCRKRFHSVQYTVVSALGSAPDSNNRLTQAVNPRRVVDPLLWSVQRQ